MMKPTLKHKPSDYDYQDFLVKFANGIPLSCAQFNFLDWHEKTLSSPHFDPVLKYYLKHYRHDHAEEHSFLLPSENLKKADVARLKRRLEIFLKDTSSHLEIKLTPDAFLQFRALTYNELILYHGNQLLTGAPFFHGGVPQHIFFQWGNLFGVAKYVVLAEEKALKSNVLIYFEDLQERQLQECVLQYSHTQDKQKHSLTPALQPRQTYNDEPVLHPHSPFKIPELTLNRLKEKCEED